MNEPMPPERRSTPAGIDLTLPGETDVVVAGDWHGNVRWVQTCLPYIARSTPGTKTVIHVGDFGIWPQRSRKGFLQTVDFWAHLARIERILVTPGNHDDWSQLDSAFAAAPGSMIQLSERVFAMPRGYRFELGGRPWVSFSGAASIDRDDRTEFRDWWRSEMPNEMDVAAAVAKGPADVMISHEAVNGSTELVERFLRANPLGWGDKALEYSSLSRARVTEVYEAVKPRLLVHGHMHLGSEREFEDGHRIFSMGADGGTHNLGRLNLQTLAWEWLGDPRT